MDRKTEFLPISQSSKFAICGLPLRLDSYAGGCGFGCAYCFANGRDILKSQTFKTGSPVWVKNKLAKIFDKNLADPENYLETLLKERYTLHCGGMSDPFQPCEQELHATKKIVEITNDYGLDITFSTKSDTTYDVPVNPDLHTFQLSITNINDNKTFEACVPDFEKRYAFYCDLKSKGFKVGIRMQPFIPGVTDEKIVEKFKDADYFTIEGLKLVPVNQGQRNFIYENTCLNKEDFKCMGLLNLRPEIRFKYYAPVIAALKEYDIPYSISDNDLRKISSGMCCCGDPLVKKSTTYNVTAMIKKYGLNYTKEDVKKEMGTHINCYCREVMPKEKETLGQFIDKKFESRVSPASPKFQYKEEGEKK